MVQRHFHVNNYLFFRFSYIVRILRQYLIKPAEKKTHENQIEISWVHFMVEIKQPPKIHHLLETYIS